MQPSTLCAGCRVVDRISTARFVVFGLAVLTAWIGFDSGLFSPWWTSVPVVGFVYLVLRHDGAPDRARVDFASVARIVREWFPSRGIAIEAALSTTPSEHVDGQAALALAESLGTPLVTKNEELRSDSVPVLSC